MTDRTFPIREAIRFGWNAAKSNFGLFFGTFALWLTLNGIPDAFLGRGEAGPARIAFAGLVLVVIQIVVSMGVIKISLRFCDNERPTYGDLFYPTPLFFRYLSASVMYLLIVLAGLLLLVVPGIVWAIHFGFARYAIVDKDLGPIEALRMSSAMTKGAKWQLLLFDFALVGVNVLGALVVFIGLLWTIPTTLVASAYVYRKLLAQIAPALTVPSAGGARAT